MRTIWQSLAWKEWHEHKWKFVSIVAILSSTVALALTYGETDSARACHVYAFALRGSCGGVHGPHAAANERSRGTLPFLQCFGAHLVWLESSRHGDALTVRQMDRQVVTGNFYLDVVLLSTTLAASLFIWSAASGVNRKDESQRRSRRARGHGRMVRRAFRCRISVIRLG